MISNPKFQKIFFAFVVGGSFVWFRFLSISAKNSFNPDEAELLANAKRAAISLVPYKDFTTPTYGVVWPYFLVVINKLGIPLTIPMAHLLSCLIGVSVSLLLLFAVQRYLGNSLGFIAVFPFTLMWAIGIGDSDFQSLSTELLPLLLITIGSYMASRENALNRDILVASCLVGAGAWAKYSFAPISFVILGVFVFLLTKKNGGLLKQALLVGIFANIIFLIIFGIALFVVRPKHLVWETFEFTFRYIGQGGLSTAEHPSTVFRISALGGNLVKCFPLVVLFFLVAIFFEVKKKPQNKLLKSIAVSVFATGMISSLILWPMFPHYNLLIICSGVAGILLVPTLYSTLDADYIEKNSPDSKIIGYVSLLCLVLVAILYAPSITANQLTTSQITIRTPWMTKSATWERATTKEGSPLSKTCAPGSKVVVWGWSSELYSYYDWTPASRYVNTVVLIYPNEINTKPVRYRENFTREIHKNQPDCIVDATGPSFFPGYGPEKQMSVQMPELWNELRKTYRQEQFFYDGVNPFEVLVREENIANRD